MTILAADLRFPNALYKTEDGIPSIVDTSPRPHRHTGDAVFGWLHGRHSIPDGTSDTTPSTDVRLKTASNSKMHHMASTLKHSAFIPATRVGSRVVGNRWTCRASL